jgi:hypothetical protein
VRVRARTALACAPSPHAARALTALTVLLATAAFAEQPLATYPGATHTRIGNDLVIAGEYYRLAYFTTADPMKKVARHFLDGWRKDGYPTTVDGDLEAEAVVSAFYTREGLMRSVVLRRHAGKTVGFTALKDLWLREPAPDRPELLQLEGMLFSTDVTTREDTGGTRSRTLLVEAGLPEARERVVKQLGGAGWLLAREAAGREAGVPTLVLELTRGPEQVVATITELDPTLSSVAQTWIGSDRPDAIPNDVAVKALKDRVKK